MSKERIRRFVHHEPQLNISNRLRLFNVCRARSMRVWNHMILVFEPGGIPIVAVPVWDQVGSKLRDYLEEGE